MCNLQSDLCDASVDAVVPNMCKNFDYSGADFTKGLKPDFGLKFKTLVLNSGKNVLSQRG